VHRGDAQTSKAMDLERALPRKEFSFDSWYTRQSSIVIPPLRHRGLSTYYPALLVLGSIARNPLRVEPFPIGSRIFHDFLRVCHSIFRASRRSRPEWRGGRRSGSGGTGASAAAQHGQAYDRIRRHEYRPRTGARKDRLRSAVLVRCQRQRQRRRTAGPQRTIAQLDAVAQQELRRLPCSL
jgi:hypothetical protein